MRLSQSEHNIRESLEQREIMPSKHLWDNIQQELDNQEKPKKKNVWYRVASVAAILCLVFLAYKGLTRTTNTVENYVIDSQPVITTPILLEAEMLTTSIAKEPVKVSSQMPSFMDVSEGMVEEKTRPVEKQTDPLVDKASELLAMVEAEHNQVQLEDEVDALLASVARQNTSEEEQDIINALSAELLLAEVESEIDPIKPAKFSDKVWGVLVANFKDMKQDLALN